MKLSEHENDTTVRAGIIIRLAGTDKILTELAWGKYPPNNYRDIVKGHITQGEDIAIGACREAKEETGLDINPDDILKLGLYNYGGSVIQMYYIEKDFNLDECHCDSIFTNNWGKDVPEVRAFELFDMKLDNVDDKGFYFGLRPILKQIFKDILENKDFIDI